MTEKILSHDKAEAWVRQHRLSGSRVGFTSGAFDILHAGHVDYLERARQLCDRLLVAVNSDSSIRAYKNPLRPINPQDQRMRVMAGLAAVDAVTLLEDERPAALLARLRPDFYIKGGDYSLTRLRSREVVEAYGGKAVVIPVEVATSTSAIIERILVTEAHVQPLRLPTPCRDGIVFLDRDGTIIRNVPFLHEPARVELLPGVAEGLALLQQIGFRLVIVTNQQGIGLGYYDTDALIATNQALFRLLAPSGVRISRVYFCPHSLAADCACRKPRTALLESALREMGTDAARCYLIGDSQADVDAGQALGIRSYKISQAGAPSFLDVVHEILANDRKSPERQSKLN